MAPTAKPRSELLTPSGLSKPLPRTLPPNLRQPRRVYDDCMATWEDGPEYAPIERPSGFQNPDARPLDVAPPYPQVAAWAPKNRPAFDSPERPVAPLSTLTPVREEPRDPQEPFAVVSSTMTSDSAWGAVHWAAPTGQQAAASWSAQPSAHHLPPEQPISVRDGGGDSPKNYPTPGTPEWFGPAPYRQQPQPTTTVSARAVLDAATPGLCMCLIIGGLVSLLAPIILCISVGLAGRVKVATAEVRRTHLLGIGVLAVIGVLGLLVVDTGFVEWWHFLSSWGLLICWALLISTLAMVYRRLKSHDSSPPTYRSPWGPDGRAE